MADACTQSLAGVYLGRLDQNSNGQRSIELMVLNL
jgi:hypothetical protein